MKILAIANAHALAHVTRLLEIAKILRLHGHEILFAGYGKYLQVASWDGFPTQELPYITVEQALRAIRSQKLWELYPESQLETFIAAELELYRVFQPDLVLLDNRPTARTSAEKAGLKTAAVLNVHMSNHKRIPFFSVTHLMSQPTLPGLDMLDRMENTIECFLYDRFVMRGLNTLRKRFGLKRLFGYQHEEAELTFFADIPEFSPVRRMPPATRYIGPLTWHNQLPAPACLERLQVDKPTVYLSLGSESLEDLMTYLGMLAREGIQLVVATGAVTFERDASLPEGVFLEQFVNAERLLPHCDLVCCHGGNGTLYQALFFGLPLVVVATHEEQYYGGKRIQSLGLGRALTLQAVKRKGPQQVIEALQAVLANPGYREQARQFATYLQGWTGPEIAAAEIEKYAGHA